VTIYRPSSRELPSSHVQRSWSLARKPVSSRKAYREQSEEVRRPRICCRILKHDLFIRTQTKTKGDGQNDGTEERSSRSATEPVRVQLLGDALDELDLFPTANRRIRAREIYVSGIVMTQRESNKSVLETIGVGSSRPKVFGRDQLERVIKNELNAGG
jgi:hypothetical protein